MRRSGATTIRTAVLRITVFIGPELTMRRNPIRVARADRSAEAFQSGTPPAAGSKRRHPEWRERVADRAAGPAGGRQTGLAYGGNVRGGGGGPSMAASASCRGAGGEAGAGWIG